MNDQNNPIDNENISQDEDRPQNESRSQSEQQNYYYTNTAQQGFHQPQYNPEPVKKKDHSTTSLVLGIVSVVLFVTCCCSPAAIVTSIIGIILALKSRSPEINNGKMASSAMAGLIMSIASLVFTILVLLFWFFVIIFSWSVIINEYESYPHMFTFIFNILNFL